MKLGIAGGCGIVGSALEFGFKKLGHQVVVHDIKLNTKIEDLSSCEIIYICVPTPLKEDNSCDTSIVESVVDEIHAKIRISDNDYSFYKNYYNDPIIAIKSTVIPETTKKLSEKYDNQNICFVPEFLRERCAVADFTELNRLLVVGVQNLYQHEKISNPIIKSHGYFPKNIMVVTATEAEIIKYYHNSLNALHITFSNEIYELCQKSGAIYNNVKDAVLITSEMPNKYMDVCDGIRGYSSVCLNKDIPAITKYSNDLGLNLKLLNTIENANNEFKKTPFNNTRENY
jgi:UDPglucose 6-dehydrogenase